MDTGAIRPSAVEVTGTICPSAGFVTGTFCPSNGLVTFGHLGFLGCRESMPISGFSAVF
jgi:hypothetical protein